MPLPTHATPTVHLNGDNGWELMHQHTVAIATAKQLRRELVLAAPHQRNYPASAETYLADLRLFSMFQEQLSVMIASLEATRVHIDEQGA